MSKQKYLWRTLTFLMVAMLSFGLSSCGDDDDDKVVSNSDLVGFWVKEAHLNNPVRNGSSGTVTSYGFQFLDNGNVYVFQLQHTGLGSKYSYAEANTSWEKMTERNGISFFINPDKKLKKYTRAGNQIFVDITSEPTILTITGTDRISAISSDGWAEGSYVRIQKTDTQPASDYDPELYGIHAYVNLGLPSGTLWATMNVGATSPEDYGDYFAWGETTGYNAGKTDFSWSTYKYCKGSDKKLTKYCYNSSYGNNGFTDSKTELDPADDAAYVNWGSEWRTPTKEQFDELINSSYTKTEWVQQNGVYGRKITSLRNGNSIFLPAAGCRNGTSLCSAGLYCYYWMRTLAKSDPGAAYFLYFSSGSVYTSFFSRCSGRSVRPVCKK